MMQLVKISQHGQSIYHKGKKNDKSYYIKIKKLCSRIGIIKKVKKKEKEF